MVAEFAPAHVLVVEDDQDVQDVMVAYLERDGHQVRRSNDGNQAWASYCAQTPLLVLLDVRLPGVDGLELLRRIRRSGDVPVILVTARDEDVDKIGALQMGADDYVVKPVNPAEVVARVRAVLRRTAHRPPASDQVRAGPVTVDLLSTEARVDGVPLPLTATEYRLLAHLVRHPRQTLSRAQLREASGSDDEALDRVVDAHLTNVRRKLSDAGAPAGLIETVRGFGYRLVPTARATRR